MKQHEVTLEAEDHIAWQDNTKDKRAERLFLNSTGRQLGCCVFSFSQEGKQNWQAPLALKQRVVHFCLNADGLAETYKNKRHLGKVIFCLVFFVLFCFSWKAMPSISVTGGVAPAQQFLRSVSSHNSCCSSSNVSIDNVAFPYTWMLGFPRFEVTSSHVIENATLKVRIEKWQLGWKLHYSCVRLAFATCKLASKCKSKIKYAHKVLLFLRLSRQSKH